MIYKFTYKTSPFDLWQLSMYSIYNSMVGVCNIIFTVAMVLLSGRFWQDVNIFVKVLLIMAICLFTIIQPMVVYIRAKRQLSAISQDIEIGFDDYGIHVKTGNKKSDLKWHTIKAVSKKLGMVIIYSTTKHGFVLTNKVLGKEKQAFYNYVLLKIQK